jgi:tellurite resistance protein TerC
MEFLDAIWMGKAVWLWLGFIAIVLTLLAFDLGLFHRDDHGISVPESLRMSAFYISVGLLYGVFVWQQLGAQLAQEYYTGFIIEKTLSLDNIFVISLVFSYFSIPRKYQHRVLFWGILGVIMLRGIMIALGAEIVHRFEWALYIFASFLIFTGVKMLMSKDKEHNIGDNFILKLTKKHLRVTNELHGNRFFVRLQDANTGKMATFSTPLFMALIVVEFVDLIFAVDSVPAIFAITTDPYIVYTSNVFAILGLRALYFALAAMLHRFEYLKYSLSVVLIFIGAKVFYPLLGMGEKVPSAISLSITVSIIGMGVLYSLVKTKKAAK